MSKRRHGGARMPIRGGRALLQTTGTILRGGGDLRRPNPIPEWHPERREHLWTVLFLFRINVERYGVDPEYAPLFDFESMIGEPMGPGCFHCEKPYTRERAAAPCPGTAP